VRRASRAVIHWGLHITLQGMCLLSQALAFAWTALAAATQQ